MRIPWHLGVVRFPLLLLTGASLLAQAQTFTVLYSFTGYPRDGAGPIAGLLMDFEGNLYGTTAYGGNTNRFYCANAGDLGCGTVYKLDTKGKETVLHNFTGPDGATPIAGLIMDAKGTLYGTTLAGGRLQVCTGSASAGCGVVFKLSGKKLTVLYRFCSEVNFCADGAFPYAGVVMDASGALYGTTYVGGPPNYNDGVVFKLVGKKETVLHGFKGFPDGAYPEAGLVMDLKGNLYGTASSGGDRNSSCGGCGTVFKLAGKQLTVLHAFKGTPDGDTPVAALLLGPHGGLYGTTEAGGSNYSIGTVFEVAPYRKERVLYPFMLPADGFGVRAGVVRDAEGNLYGVAEEGGTYNAGLAFEITKGKEKILHEFCSFKNCADGSNPTGNLIMDANGNIYGTAYNGGADKNGVIFRISP